MLFRSFRFKFPFSISFFSIIFPLFNPRSRGTITVRTTTWRFEMGTQKAVHCWADSVVMTNPTILNPVPTSSGWSLCLTVLSTRLDLLLISSKVRWTFLLYGSPWIWLWKLYRSDDWRYSSEFYIIAQHFWNSGMHIKYLANNQHDEKFKERESLIIY